MKKFTLVFGILLCYFGVSAQSQRLVLLEHFTQASCGPCATYNPAVHNLLVANPDKITAINYHTSWPGFDPMYNHNPADANAKVSYYGITGVPTSVLGGNYYKGSPAGWNINTVNGLYAIPTPMEVSIYQQFSPNQDTLHVAMRVLATGNVNASAVAYMVIIEKHIHFNSAPGSNGEKDFYNVMKKILPVSSGIALPQPMMEGEYVLYQASWPLANVYNIDQLSVIGFVQNTINKEVYQAANMTEGDYIALYDNDVELMSFSNMSDQMCKTFINPVLKFRNNGNTPLTSMQIQYRVNNEEVHTYDWTGNLPLLGTATINFPTLDFQLLEENNLQAYITQVNNGSDDYVQNDTLNQPFMAASVTSHSVLVKVRTDNHPEQTTWEIKNKTGETVASGGPYTEVGKIINTEVELSDDGCYEFFIYDAGGNGLCCSEGAGFYRLTSGSATVASGSSFGEMEVAQFSASSVGVNFSPALTDFEVYPNPTSNQLFIEFTPERNRNIKLSIFNQLGKVVYRDEVIAPSDITQKLNINTGNWPAGIYMIRMDNGSGISSSKVSVSR